MAKPLILKVNKDNPSLSVIKQTAEIIKKGGLVILPTDTVYGLSCDATNSKAVAKVFKVRKRPFTQPLSIALSNYEQLRYYVKEFPKTAQLLVKKFLPGALTLILKKSKLIPDIVTASRNDIGIRIPDCKIVHMIIDYAQVPIVIPSANLHNQPSPTCVQQLSSELIKQVDLILDGGKTTYGIESTIVLCFRKKIKIIREGAIPSAKIFAVLNQKC